MIEAILFVALAWALYTIARWLDARWFAAHARRDAQRRNHVR